MRYFEQVVVLAQTCYQNGHVFVLNHMDTSLGMCLFFKFKREVEVDHPRNTKAFLRPRHVQRAAAFMNASRFGFLGCS